VIVAAPRRRSELRAIFKSDIEAIVALSENATSHAAVSERMIKEGQRKRGALETS
jgi:hypothetical protein